MNARHEPVPAAGKGNRVLIVSATIATILLLALGTWQVLRLQQKQDLIAARKSAVVASPVALTDIEAGIEHGYDVDFLRVRMTGTYRHDATRYVFRARGDRPGFQVITPFIAQSAFIVLVDRGFIDQPMIDSPDQWSQPVGEIAVTGISRLRAGDRNMFSPEPDITRQVWYWYDLMGIAASLPADIADGAGDPPPITASVFVQVEPGGEPASGAYPDPEDLKVELPNNHLQYVVTWYSLALVLVVMSWLFIRRRRAEVEGAHPGEKS